MKYWAKSVNEKLSLKYFGPFKILDRIRLEAYQLELHVNRVLHLVLHISQFGKELWPMDYA